MKITLDPRLTESSVSDWEEMAKQLKHYITAGNPEFESYELVIRLQDALENQLAVEDESDPETKDHIAIFPDKQTIEFTFSDVEFAMDNPAKEAEFIGDIFDEVVNPTDD